MTLQGGLTPLTEIKLSKNSWKYREWGNAKLGTAVKEFAGKVKDLADVETEISKIYREIESLRHRPLGGDEGG